MIRVTLERGDGDIEVDLDAETIRGEDRYHWIINSATDVATGATINLTDEEQRHLAEDLED